MGLVWPSKWLLALERPLTLILYKKRNDEEDMEEEGF